MRDAIALERPKPAPDDPLDNQNDVVDPEDDVPGEAVVDDPAE